MIDDLADATWDRELDDLFLRIADKLGEADGVLILDDTGFVKKGTTSAGVQRQYSSTAGAPRTARSASSPPNRGSRPEDLRLGACRGAALAPP